MTGREIIRCQHVVLGAPVKASATLSGVDQNGTPLESDVHVCDQCVVRLLDALAPKVHADTQVSLRYVDEPERP